MSALLIAIGGLVGLLLGALGGGGSMLAVPSLVYAGGLEVQSAQAGALTAVSIAAAAGLVGYLKRGDVRWRAGLAFGAAASVSSLLGSMLSRQMDGDVLMLAFSPVMAVAAVAMLNGRSGEVSRFQPWRFGVSRRSVIKVLALGFTAGWLTGVFGVGGGFIIVPILVTALGFAMPEAIGTSLLVILISSLVALVDRWHGLESDLTTVLPFTIAAAFGVAVGIRLRCIVPASGLSRAFAVLLLVAAAYTAAISGVALA